MTDVTALGSFVLVSAACAADAEGTLDARWLPSRPPGLALLPPPMPSVSELDRRWPPPPEAKDEADAAAAASVVGGGTLVPTTTAAQAAPVPAPPDPLPLVLLALLPDRRWVGGAPLSDVGGPRSRPDRDMCPPTPTPTPTPVEADSPSHDEYRSLALAAGVVDVTPDEAAVALETPRSADVLDGGGGGRSNTAAWERLPLRSALPLLLLVAISPSLPALSDLGGRPAPPPPPSPASLVLGVLMVEELNRTQDVLYDTSISGVDIENNALRSLALRATSKMREAARLR